MILGTDANSSGCNGGQCAYAIIGSGDGIDGDGFVKVIDLGNYFDNPKAGSGMVLRTMEIVIAMWFWREFWQLCI